MRDAFSVVPFLGALRACVATLAMFLVAPQGASAQTMSSTNVAVYPDLLEGTLSAGGDLEDDEQTRTGFFRRPTALEPWFAWKQRIRKEHGLGFGGSWGVLWQSYSSTPIDEKNAVGSKFALNFSYDLWNRNMPDALTFAMAIEDRRPLGTDLPPLFAGLGAGSIVPTAATWSEFDLGITQAYIRQNLFQNRFQYTIGKIFAPSFVNPYPFFDGNRQFLNQQFSSSPTIALPLRGFGMVAAWYPGASGFYVKPGMFTPYSDDTGSTISDFFNRNEYFYMLEAGFSSLAQSGTPINARGAMDVDNIHLTAWYRDALPDGTPRAYGFAFNVNQRIGTDFMGFLRAGWSEGWQADRAWSVGLGWRPASAPSDLMGAAVGSTYPTSSLLRTQTTVEMFYRFHVTPNFAITPDVQAIFDPSLNPAKDTLWVFSLRTRVTF